LAIVSGTFQKFLPCLFQCGIAAFLHRSAEHPTFSDKLLTPEINIGLYDQDSGQVGIAH
jgi:hypothetical protein